MVQAFLKGVGFMALIIVATMVGAGVILGGFIALHTMFESYGIAAVIVVILSLLGMGGAVSVLDARREGRI